MENEREKALELLKDLTKKFGENAKNIFEANEAKTRLLLIDEIMSILGWSKEEFNPEEPTPKGQYIDYLLKIDDSPRLVIEAKRIGNTFSPLKKLHKTHYAVSYIKSAFGQAFCEVLEQAEKYAHDTQVPYGVITNGIEWSLITLIPPPGKDISELKCIHFGNLFSEHPNFDLLWEFLAKSSIENGILEEGLCEINPLEAEVSIIPSDVLGDLRWKEKDFNAEYINEFYDRFFGEIVDPRRREMLTHCFVTSSKIEQYQGQLKRLLVDVAPHYIEDTKELTPGDHKKVIFAKSGDQKGRVIIITGSVGAGKTTFITKARIENRDNNSLKFLYLDLIDEGVAENISSDDLLWALACEVWREVEPDALSYFSLKETFHTEIELLKKGGKSKFYEKNENAYIEDEGDLLQSLASEPKKFLEKSWKYYNRKKNSHIILVLDNVDKASESYQRHAYSFAHKASSSTGVNVIVTMREGTFFRGKEFGFLDVRSNDMVFHLQSPDIKKIISRRIKYIEEHLEEDFRWKSWRESGGEDNFTEAIYLYADVIKNSLLKDSDGNRSCEILASAAWHNIRRFLELLKRVHKFLGVNSERWSIRDILTALVLPSETDLNTPITSNLFQPVANRQRCYFLKLRILIYLCHGVKNSESQRGIKYSKLLKFIRGYGYRESWLYSAIEEMVKDRLLECMELPTEMSYTKDYVFDKKNTFRSSPLGALLSELMCLEPSYLISIGWDLPLYDNVSAQNFISKVKSLPVIPTEITSEDIELLIDEGLDEYVTNYLSDSLRFEEMRYKNYGSFHEYQIVEEFLKKITIGFVSQNVEDTNNFGTKKDDIQLTLDFPGLFSDLEKIEPIIDVPDKILEIKYSSSASLPKILWSLVHLRMCGVSGATGAEITRIINNHLLDDQHSVEPTNISRALRSPIIKSQKWIVAKKSHKARSTIFLLGEGWEDVWEEIFLVKPPSYK
ncbi:MAG: hypothetical protein OQK95_00020 [Gammaproteobacteria bacterium]|nr:hypothetical protein [Gammaproteobacteria bacterium]